MLLLSISYLIMRPDSDIETYQNKQAPRKKPPKGAVPMTAVREILSFFIITLALLVLPAFVCVHAAAASDWPLEIVNESGVEITSLRISYTGAEKWSENRVASPVPDGGRAELDIGRGSILGISDIKITAGGREIIWRRLPILEIFSITVDGKLEPRYERIKLGA